MYLYKYFFALSLLTTGYVAFSQDNDPNLKLWYNKPATAWEEALPLGNGTTGAMRGAVYAQLAD